MSNPNGMFHSDQSNSVIPPNNNNTIYKVFKFKRDDMPNYTDIDLKIPEESDNYKEHSELTVNTINDIFQNAIKNGRNKIVINTNLKLGIPMENVNKIAGPFVEAWAFEIFNDALEDEHEKYKLDSVSPGKRLDLADVIITLNNNDSLIYGNVDVKATSKDIANSGKSPNITSFVKIRSIFLKHPDFMFLVLSIKHRVSSERDEETKMMMGIMEIVDFNVYDLKYISDSDISYNPALGTGQLQIRDIHNVSYHERTANDLCQLLDKKCIASQKGFDVWFGYAKKNEWLISE